MNVKRLVREPLVHFIAIGALIFAAYPAASPTVESSNPARITADPRAPIVIDDHVRNTLTETWKQTHNAPPTAAELKRLTQRWIDREILYREGMARGFDQDDYRIRALVADKMTFVLASQSVIADPTEAELRAFFNAHGDRFAQAELVDFIHVFVHGDDNAARARAGELLTLLQSGASPAGLGDTFSGGRHYRRRRIEDLARVFGADFVRGLDGQKLDTWVMRKSRFGFHVVRVVGREPAEMPDFEAVRLEVQEAWREHKEAQALEAKLAALRDKWEIVVEP